MFAQQPHDSDNSGSSLDSQLINDESIYIWIYIYISLSIHLLVKDDVMKCVP